ncbi:MAG: glycosyltransferase family 39 protein [Anaerolineae bacterium]|nr:glycosyltransferase family 39 protein [Anaerolineae bacterium]
MPNITIFHNRRLQLLAEFCTLLLIILLAAYLRLTGIEGNPGWYTDEGTHLAIAQQLTQGRIQYLAVNRSFLLFGRLPLFELLLTGAVQLFGLSMTTLRALGASLEILAVVMLYAIIRWVEPKKWPLALLAPFLLAIYPQAVLYSRMGFSYHLLTPLVLLACLGLTQYLGTSARRWMIIAALSIGIGLLSDLMIGALVLPLILVGLYKHPRDLLWALSFLALPFGLYAMVMLITDASVFLFDLNYTLSRLGGLPVSTQIYNAGLNYTVLLSQDFWFPLGIVGLFLLVPRYFRAVCLMLLLLPILVIGRTVALYSLSAYYIVPLLPFAALGMASLIYHGVPMLWLMTSQIFADSSSVWLRRVASVSIAILLILPPLAISLLLQIGYVQDRFPTAIDPFLLDSDAAKVVADYINTHTMPDELVVASPGIAWLFHANTADFQMSVAATGEETVHLPANLPQDRFAFDPAYNRARYIVVDNLWHNWGAVHMPQVAVMLTDVESWPTVLQADTFTVYQNPERM